MDTLETRLQKRIHASLYALLFLTVLLGLSVLLEGCTDTCEVTQEYTYFEPVYTTVQEIRQSVELTTPQPVHAVGKIYFKDGVLFLNEPGEGIHLIDNSDPSHPSAFGFLRIPGNYDLAIKGNTLYADSYVDLIAFNIADLGNIEEVGRLEGVFKNYTSMGFMNDVNCCVITDWTPKKQVSVYESECGIGNIQPWGGIFYEDGIAFASSMASGFNSKAATAPGNGSGPGVGGSLARFTITDNHLYMLDGSDLQVVDISAPSTPALGNRQTVSWDIETIFPYDQKLFVGSRSGLRIFDLDNPESPDLVSTYEHVMSCDPVVVEGDRAYVTLRTGNTCWSGTNQLEVINIENPASPQLIKTYSLTNPHGLGIDQKTLFVCDGPDGLKVFDATDDLQIDTNLLASFSNIKGIDVIPINNVLMMIAEDGLYQYDYSNKTDIKLLSTLPLVDEE